MNGSVMPKIAQMGKFASAFTFIFVTTVSALAWLRILFGGWSPLNPRDITWFQTGDNFAAYVAQLFYLQDSWRFPLLANPNYGGFLTSSINLTGPSPILAITLKLLRVNPELQFYGYWILVNFVLQLTFAYILLRRLDLSFSQALLSMNLFITPFLLFRTLNHFWLISHFVLVWTLDITVRSIIKKSKLSSKEVASVTFISLLSGTYIAVMCIVILLTLTLLENLQSSRVHFSLSLFMKKNLSILIPFLTYAFFFDKNHQNIPLLDTAKSMVSVSYGKAAFNLLSFFNPDTGMHRVSVVGPEVIDRFSVTGFSLGSTWGSYEGFMYLGFGLLFGMIFVASKISYRRFSNLKKCIYSSSNLCVLAILVMALFIFSVTNRISIGNSTLEIPLPRDMILILGIFRSSGRFMWPIAYGVITAIIVATVRNTPKFLRAEYALVLILIIQCLDMIPPLMRREANLSSVNSASYVEAKELKSSFTLEYQQKSSKYKFIRQWPLGDVIEGNYARLNYAAWKMNQTTDLINTARSPMKVVYARADQTYMQLCSGNLEKNTLYSVTKIRIKEFSNCLLMPEAMFSTDTHFYFGKSIKS